jgi:hypothetical protein
VVPVIWWGMLCLVGRWSCLRNNVKDEKAGNGGCGGLNRGGVGFLCEQDVQDEGKDGQEGDYHKDGLVSLVVPGVVDWGLRDNGGVPGVDRNALFARQFLLAGRPDEGCIGGLGCSGGGGPNRDYFRLLVILEE